MGIINRLTRASNLATVAFRSGWSGMDKLQPANSTYARRMEQYFLMQSAYDGDIFVDNQRWRPYLLERDLHEKTMCVINPTQRLCDFYAGSIYPGGYLSSTGYPVIPNVPLAIPIVTSDAKIRAAIGQIWQWSNWEENLEDWIRMGAILGDAPVEIVDDVASGKVYPVIVRPEFITDVKIDDRKNVTEYTKELYVREPNTDTEQYYLYTRTITKEKIFTYKNHKEFGYNGLPPVYDNPYGFVPLVWVKHRDPGKGILPGKPAVRDWRKVEELNSDYTRLRMYIRKQALTPMLLAAMGEITPPISEVDGEEIDIEDMMILTAAADGTVYKLEGNLELKSAFDGIRMQMEEIDQDHPELKAEENIKQMSQITGPASQDLLGNVVRNVKSASKSYDRATKSMHQQMLAIAGMRANEGAEGWADLSPQQKKFLPFNLDSFVNGDLEFSIAPRDALPRSEFDRAKMREQRYLTYAAGERANIPLEAQWEDEDMPEERRKMYRKAQEENRIKQLKETKENLELQSKYNVKLPAQKQTPAQKASTNETRSLESKIVNGTGK